jgi:hypothetical protein
MIHTLFALINPRFRRQRMAEFQSTFPETRDSTVLDVGGTPMNWNLIGSKSRITLLNIRDPSPSDTADAPSNLRFVRGDGTHLQYPDKSFDLAFSNSVIEHVGTWENQKRFAAEISRVAENLWVQTPSRWFFIETHLITPFVHYLPKSWQRKLIRNFTIWGLLTRPDQAEVEGFLEEVRLVTYREMRRLFPDCEIRKEKFLLMTKSFIAVRTAKTGIADGRGRALEIRAPAAYPPMPS